MNSDKFKVTHDPDYTFHVHRDDAGVYSAHDKGGVITVTALSLDKLLQELEEAIAVLSPTVTDIVVPIKIIFKTKLLIPGDDDAQPAPILFPY